MITVEKGMVSESIAGLPIVPNLNQNFARMTRSNRVRALKMADALRAEGGGAHLEKDYLAPYRPQKGEQVVLYDINLRGQTQRKPIPLERLQAYRKQYLTAREITALEGVSRAHVNLEYKRHGIRMGDKPVTGSGGRNWPVTPPSKAKLEELYIHQQLSSGEIASIYGVDEKTVRRRMDKFGIARRPRGTNQFKR
ncbi:MAG: hypothetical protein HY430_02050 [Candidatus Levybacteria bacterium]|nr:hypothetical protein [Candidatus Levybacteria bacterium]